MNPALAKSYPIMLERSKAWYYVYLLKSDKTKYNYIGCTSNLKKRLKEHQDGRVYSTKKMLPLELLYYEAYRSKESAYQREKHLKSYGSGLAKLLSRISIDKKGRAG